MDSVGQTASLRHRPFTILVVPIAGNRIKHTPPTHGTATPTEITRQAYQGPATPTEVIFHAYQGTAMPTEVIQSR